MAINSKDTFTERNPYLVYSDEFEDTKTDIMTTVGNMLEDTAITLSKEAVRAFDTVAEMQACTSLMEGMICHTNGFHESGDGGAAFYIVSDTGTADNIDVFTLQNGLFAHFVNVDSSRTILTSMFSRESGENDDSAKMQRVIDYAIDNKILKIIVDEYLEINSTVYINPTYSSGGETLLFMLEIVGLEDASYVQKNYLDRRLTSGFYTTSETTFNMFHVGYNTTDGRSESRTQPTVAFRNLNFINQSIFTSSFAGNPTFINLWRSTLILENSYMYGANYGVYQSTDSDNYCQYLQIRNVVFIRIITNALKLYRNDAATLDNIRLYASLSSAEYAFNLQMVFAADCNHIIAGQGDNSALTALFKLTNCQMELRNSYIEKISSSGGYILDLDNSIASFVDSEVLFEKSGFAYLRSNAKVSIDRIRTANIETTYDIINGNNASALANIGLIFSSVKLSLTHTIPYTFDGTIPVLLVLKSTGLVRCYTIDYERSNEFTSALKLENNGSNGFILKPKYTTPSRVLINSIELNEPNNFVDEVRLDRYGVLKFYKNSVLVPLEDITADIRFRAVLTLA